MIVRNHLSAVALEILSTSKGMESLANDELRAVLHAGARHDAIVAIAAEGTSAAALRSLSDRKIPFVVMKGPASARFHPDPTKRTYSDLDLLVSPRHFKAATEVLVQLGYVRKRESEPLWAAFDRCCVEGFNFHLTTVGNIDLHHHVSPWRFGSGLRFDSVIDRSDRGLVAGESVRLASARDCLIISSLHVINDLGKDTPSFNSWRDIAVIFDQLLPRDFSRVFDEADLGWFAPYIGAALADLGAEVLEDGFPVTGRRLQRGGERLRLGLMGWNGTSVLAPSPDRMGSPTPRTSCATFFVRRGSAISSLRSC